ncbi:YceI family protein [Marilutibacter alkalisoli]|uniref:YceI family protein n=1 Tax=Marilutibacter alkalisoli TaxID=2591633 RepID=A0A514BPK0_9GAMM|nr:YceI family protein [Lysobacter alkalisoli]
MQVRSLSPTPRRTRTFPGALLALLALPAMAAGPGAYNLDPVHTRVLVEVGHAGFSQALGTVSGSEGRLLFDPDDWSTAQLEVRVPLDRLDFGDEAWNRAVARRGLLDSGRHPWARFVSASVTPHDDRHARVCGELSMRGTTRPLCLEVTFNALARYPLPPFRRTAGFSATATLSRTDYGITAWPTVIGDTIVLRIEAEAVRDTRAARTLDPAVPAMEQAVMDQVIDEVTLSDDDTYRTLEEAAEAALQDDDTDTDDEPPP